MGGGGFADFFFVFLIGWRMDDGGDVGSYKERVYIYMLDVVI